MGLFDKKKNKEVEEQPTEEIVILEAELDDDDPDAPMGTLVSLPEDEKQPTEEVVEEAPVEEESIEENEEIVDETPTEETTEEPVEEEISEEPQEEEPTIAEEVPIEESAQEEVAEEETPIEDEAPVAEEEQTVEETPIEEPIEEVQEEPVAEEEKEEPAQEEEKVEEVKQPKVAAQQIAIDASPNDGSQDKNLKNDLDNVLGTDYKVEEQPKPAPAPKKIAAPAKKDNKEIWGKVVFTKKEEPKKEDEPKKEPAKKAPAKKAEPKKVEKAEEAPVKKAPAKKAPVKKEEVKEEQPEAAPVKETKQKQNKNTEKEGAKTMAKYEPEKIVTAGDASQPHGKFVIRKTDNDNFVFKLISSNKRVVAIGAQAYTGLPGVKGGIQSVIKNAAKAPIQDSTLQKVVELKFPKWEIWVDKKGEFRLRLYASNGELVASTNDGYTSKPAAKNGIDAIARACIGCDIVRNDDPKAY